MAQQLFQRWVGVSLDGIWKTIDERYGAFSPQLRRAARFVRENPQRVALQSLRALAGEAGVSPASMTRLTQALDFASWDAFQDQHRDWLTTGSGGVFSGPAGRLLRQSHKAGSQDALVDDIAAAETRNVALALARDGRTALHEAAALLAGSPAIHVLGVRSCHAVAFAFHYSLSLFAPRVVLVGGTGGLLLDDMHRVEAGDALVAISVAPYSRETVDAVRFAKGVGAAIVGITDAPLSPIAREADIALIAGNASAAHIASPIGPMAAAQALALLVMARLGEPAIDRMRSHEAALAAISAYLPEDSS